MDENSTDIYQANSIEYYPLRPDNLSQICLADFMADFNRHKSKSPKNNVCDNLNEDLEINDENQGKLYELKNNAGCLEKRRKTKIIRFRRYNVKPISRIIIANNVCFLCLG